MRFEYKRKRNQKQTMSSKAISSHLVKDIIRARAKNKYPRTTLQSIRDHKMLTQRIKKLGIKFDYVTAYLEHIHGIHNTVCQLLTQASIYSEIINIKIDRLAKRNKQALLCWYTENWDSVLPLLPLNFYEISIRLKNKKDHKEIKKDNLIQIDISDINQLLNFH